MILASEGYPLSYQKGFTITMDETIRPHVLFAGVREQDGRLVTSGGRVLGVVGRAANLKDALALAYDRAERIGFSNRFYRRDIGKRALEA